AFEEIERAAGAIRGLFGLHLKDDATLAQVAAGIDRLRGLAREHPSGEGVAEELDFWAGWVKTYLPVDAMPGEAMMLQERAVNAAKSELGSVWREIVDKLPKSLNLMSWERESPRSTLREIERVIDRRGGDDTLEVYARRVRPFVDAQEAFEGLESGSPMARE